MVIFDNSMKIRSKVDLLKKARRVWLTKQAAAVTTSSLASSFNGLDRKKHDFWRKSVGLFQIPTLASPYGFLKEKVGNSLIMSLYPTLAYSNVIGGVYT